MVFENWVRQGKKEKCIANRVRMIILSATGEVWQSITKRIGVTSAIATKWRKRFVQHGIEGFLNFLLLGKPTHYVGMTERCMLAFIDIEPPVGFCPVERIPCRTVTGWRKCPLFSLYPLLTSCDSTIWRYVQYLSDMFANFTVTQAPLSKRTTKIQIPSSSTS